MAPAVSPAAEDLTRNLVPILPTKLSGASLKKGWGMIMAVDGRGRKETRAGPTQDADQSHCPGHILPPLAVKSPTAWVLPTPLSDACPIRQAAGPP